MPSHVFNKMGGLISACYRTSGLNRTESRVEFRPSRKSRLGSKLLGNDNPLSDRIVEEEDTTNRNLPPEELMKLLRSAYEAVEDIQNILPHSMKEIDLENSIPSPEDVEIIFSVMNRYDQLERIVVNSINPRQLEILVPQAEHKDLKVEIRNSSITPTEADFQKLSRVVKQHRVYMETLIKSSLLSISLLNMDLTVSRFGKTIVPWITTNCTDLDHFSLMMPHSYLTEFASIVSGSPLKIKRLTLFEQIKFCREELHLSEARAICDLIVNVTEKMFLDFKVEDPFLLGIIQTKLNSQPQTNLEIQFDQIPGLYRLRWRKPMISPRSRAAPVVANG